MLGGSRVATLVRPVDRTLEVLKFALVPVVALALSLPAIRSLTVSSDPSAGEVLLDLIGPILAVVYLLALQTETVNATLDRAIARFRRRVATACNHEHHAEHEDHGLSCRITSSAFRAPVFEYEDQDDALGTLCGACRSDESGQFWFIEGRSGTGKTRAALRFVQALVRDPSLFELGNRCFLYDFSYSEAIQEELASHLGTSRLDDAVLLVDNFQLVNPNLLKALTKRFVGDPAARGERIAVFLARESEAWNLSPGQDVRLLAEAKAGHRHFELTGPGSIRLASEVSGYVREAPSLIRKLEEKGLASAAQLHLAQVIARNRSLPPEVSDAVRLLDGESAKASPTNTRLVAVLTAVAMHRGTFSRRSLWRALRIAARESEGSTVAEAVRLAIATRSFLTVGLLPKIQLDSTRFAFHEDIARQYIDRLWGDGTFMAVFLSVGAERLGRQVDDEDAMRAWLIAVEIGDQETLAAKFDAALLKGSYQRMRLCLERARDRYGKKFQGSTLLQLGILLDRNGRFNESRALFNDGLEVGDSASSELAVILAAGRLEARHQDGYRDDLDFLVNHPDRFVAIVGEYWELHLAAHLGVFEPQRLLELAAEGFGHLHGRAGHWRLYSLGRIYFDGLRHLYLTGETDATAFASPDYEDLCQRLRSQLPTYEALRILYTEAHLVAHVLLPRVAIFGEELTGDDAARAGLKLVDVETVQGLVFAAQRLYGRVREEFGFYGDREEKYLLAEALNARMIEPGTDLGALSESLDEYEQFILGGSQNMLASYPHLYRFRRKMIGYFDAILRPETDPDPGASSASLRRAEHHLSRVLELDRAVGNRYGELRAELLMLLYRSVRDKGPPAQDELTEMERRTTHHGYGFELRLIRHLIECDPPSSLQMEQVFRFYPFVNQ